MITLVHLIAAWIQQWKTLLSFSCSFIFLNRHKHFRIEGVIEIFLQISYWFCFFLSSCLLQWFSTFLCFSNVLFLTWTWPLYITHKGCGFWLFNLNRTVLVLRIVTKVIFFSPSIRCVNLHFICLYSIWSYLIFSLICKVI